MNGPITPASSQPAGKGKTEGSNVDSLVKTINMVKDPKVKETAIGNLKTLIKNLDIGNLDSASATLKIDTLRQKIDGIQDQGVKNELMDALTSKI